MKSIAELAQTAGRHLAQDNRTTTWLDSSWWEQLQPGSWRGVPFVMDAAQNIAGRRTVLHEYPYRDTVWPEDLGKLPRRFAFQAFLLGDDVYQQRDAMIAACEVPGPGTLVHPTMGTMQVVLLDFSTTDRRERGRMVEVAFQFVTAGDVEFPSLLAATGDLIGNLAGSLDQAASADLSATLGTLAAIPQVATRAIPQFAELATHAVDDPTRALNATAGLQGYFGRYAAGRRGELLPASATVDSALSQSIASRSEVFAAASRLTGAAGAL